MTEPWVSADVVAEHFGVTQDSIYSWIAKEGMPANRVVRLWRFKLTEVDPWVCDDRTPENPERATGS